jgi:hypothetical protein
LMKLFLTSTSNENQGMQSSAIRIFLSSIDKQV